MMSHQGKYQKADEEDGYGKMVKRSKVLVLWKNFNKYRIKNDISSDDEFAL